MNASIVEKAIITHCYDGFPRMVGFPRQYLYYSFDELITKFWLNNGACKGIYTAVFPEHIRERKRYNKFYFDLDLEENMELAFFEAIEISNYISELFDVIPRLYFSGGKGFALYLDLQGDYVFKDYPIVHLKLAQHLKEVCAAECLDSAVIGDTSRISRLPFNIHRKSNRLCIPVNIEWSFNEILERSVNYDGDGLIKINKASENSKGFEMVKEWDDEAENFRIEIKDNLKNSGYSGNVDLDIILNKASLTHGYRRILIYRVIVPQMLINGYKKIDIHSYCEEFIKRSGACYDASTRRFVNYYIKLHKSKNWKPISLENLLMQHPELKKVFI